MGNISYTAHVSNKKSAILHRKPSWQVLQSIICGNINHQITAKTIFLLSTEHQI